MSLEMYFICNLLLNAVVLTLSARAMQATHPMRIAVAAVFGGIYALCALYTPWLSSFSAVWIVAWILTAISQPYRGAIRLARGSMLTVSFAMLFGGVGLMLNQWMSGLWLICLCAICGVMLTRRLFAARHSTAKSVRLRIDGRDLTAIIDTGNGLREPISRCPVVIVEAAAIGGIAAYKKSRKVAYGSVGGQGYLPCFRPDELLVECQGWAQVTDIWVAVYDGDLGGRALAPPEIGQIVQDSRFRFGGNHFVKRLFGGKAHVGGNSVSGSG